MAIDSLLHAHYILEMRYNRLEKIAEHRRQKLIEVEKMLSEEVETNINLRQYIEDLRNMLDSLGE
jgi:hypothetical protein